MVQLTFKRYETKFVLTDDQRADLMRLMRSHVSADEYGPSTVCNVYYDTPTFLLARRSLEGPIYKEKIRARSYGVCNGHTPVFVELKKKYDGIVYKRRCTLSSIDARALLSGARVPKDQIERSSGKCTMYFSLLQGQATSCWPGASGIPTECRQGTNSPLPSTSITALPMRVMIFMLTTT